MESTCDFREVIITPTIEVKTRKEDKKCKKAVQDVRPAARLMLATRALSGPSRGQAKGSGSLHPSPSPFSLNPETRLSPSPITTTGYL